MFVLVTRAAMKFGLDSQRWSNLLAFLQSCYAGRVRNYDFDDAVAALDSLSDQEQHAIIAWVMFVEENRLASRGFH
jgi:hypothetical protein